MDTSGEAIQVPSSVVLSDAPKKRHTRTIVAISIVLAIGGGLVFALRPGDSDTPTFSLSEAQAAASDLNSFTFTIVSGVKGTPTTFEGELDQANGLLHLGIALPDPSGDLLELEMIIDLKAGRTYLNRSFFGPEAPFDTEWLRRDDLLESDESPLSLTLESITGPLDAIALIEKAILVEDLGGLLPDRVTPLEVGGVKVKEFRVTIAGDDVAAANPEFESQLDTMNGHIPDEVLYHFYIDEQNVVRRIYFEFSATRLLTVLHNVTVLSINEPLQFELPAEEDVTDLSDL